MSKEVQKTGAEIFASPKRNLLQLTIGINKITANDPSINGYARRNELLLARDKNEICKKNDRVMPNTAIALHAQTERNLKTVATARKNAVAAQPSKKIIYKKGVTVENVAIALLQAEAANTNIDHSRKLKRNFYVSSPQMTRIDETDAHHIVAWLEQLAAESRVYIFGVGIGVNDTDNCAILPRFLSTKIPSMPNALPHQHIHTNDYYTNVFFALMDIPDYTEEEVRKALRRIRNQLVAGTFQY